MEKLKFKNKTITVNNAPLNVELAETPEELKQGQRGKSEPTNMLLKFPEQGKEKSITMSGVGFPLKLAFIKKGVVTNVVKRNDPNSEKLTTYKTDAVLELPIYAKIKTGDVIKYKQGGAWTRKEGQNPNGGLNQKGRDSYNRENPGSNLKAPQPEGGSRKKSYCARSAGQKDNNNIDCTKTPEKRICLARKKWKCEDGCKFEKGGKLNQGNKPMKFVLTKANTKRDHTLDGYKIVNGKLQRNNSSSVFGYLKSIDDTKNMKQYGKNLYSKLKDGGDIPETLKKAKENQANPFGRKTPLSAKELQELKKYQEANKGKRSIKEQKQIDDGYLGEGKKGTPSGMSTGKIVPDDTAETLAEIALTGGSSLLGKKALSKGLQKAGQYTVKPMKGTLNTGFPFEIVKKELHELDNIEKIKYIEKKFNNGDIQETELKTQINDILNLEKDKRKFLKKLGQEYDTEIDTEILQNKINDELKNNGFSNIQTQITNQGYGGYTVNIPKTNGKIILHKHYPNFFSEKILRNIDDKSVIPQQYVVPDTNIYGKNIGLKKREDFPNLKDYKGAAPSIHNSINDFLKEKNLGNLLSGNSYHTEEGLNRWNKLVDRGIAEQIYFPKTTQEIPAYKLKMLGGLGASYGLTTQKEQNKKLSFKTGGDLPMVNGVADILKRVKDKENRRELANYIMKKFNSEKVNYDKESFLKKLKYKTGGNILSKLKKGGMYLLDENGEVQTQLQGGERIFSRIHTKKLIDKTLSAKTPKDLEKIGKEIIKIIDIHNNQKPQYVEE